MSCFVFLIVATSDLDYHISGVIDNVDRAYTTLEFTEVWLLQEHSANSCNWQSTLTDSATKIPEYQDNLIQITRKCSAHSVMNVLKNDESQMLPCR